MKSIPAIIFTSVLFLSATSFGREMFIGQVTATASSAAWNYYTASLTVDGSGMDGETHGNESTNVISWLSEPFMGNAVMHHDGGTEGAVWIAYEFDRVYSLGSAWVWNYNDVAWSGALIQRGLRDVTVEYSADGITWVTLGEFTFSRANGQSDYAHDTEINFGGAQARYVVITANLIDGNWGDPSNYYGLSEIRFGIFGTTQPIEEAIASYLITANASSASSAAVNAVNGSGMDGLMCTDVSNSANKWQTQTYNGVPVQHHSGGASGASWISLSFDKAYALGKMLVWNFNDYRPAYTSRGLQNVVIEYSANGTTWSKLGDYTFARATGAADYIYNTTVDFGGVMAKYVVITAKTVNGNYGATSYGLSELQFGIHGTGQNQQTMRPIIGDTNRDRKVNFKDFGILSQNWLKTAEAGDFSKDGMVDIEDLVMMMPYWLHPTPTMDGTFINFAMGEFDLYDADDWDYEFDKMDLLGFNTIILCSSVDKGYTHSTNAPKAHYQSSYYQVIAPHFETIIPMAQERGYEVYMGLYNYSNWYTYADGAQVTHNESIKIARELYDKFGSYSCFKGFYIIPEGLLNEGALIGSQVQWAGTVSHLHATYPGKKVMTAPYLICDTDHSYEPHWWHDRTPAEMGNQAYEFMCDSGLDILVLQDAMCWRNTLQDLRDYLPYINNACKQLGREFWIDTEIFQYDSSGTTFIPATIERVAEQLEIESGYDRNVMWVYRPFMTSSSPESKALLWGFYEYYIAPK